MILFSLVLIFSSSVYAAKTPPNEDFYLAAVIEYNPLPGNDTILLNTQEYVTIIKTAAEKADIIVFPEVGIFLYDRYTTFIRVPNPNEGIAPADDESCHPVLQMISSETRNQNVYVIINVHEEYSSNNTSYHYNTNVIFNRTGHIIARYRKFNLFAEPLNITSTPELVFFDSDFGVRFGTFICFDILFEKPALQLIRKHNVTDILYPTFWYAGLPFFTAVQTQAGWAYATDTNLLASGGNKVLGGQTGSGVFAGRKGPVAYLQAQRDQTTILFSKVYKKGTTGTSNGTISKPLRQSSLSHLTILADPVIWAMESYLITTQPTEASPSRQVTTDGDGHKYISKLLVVEKTICHGKFCCHFNLNMTVVFRAGVGSPQNTSLNPYLYRLAVFDGISKYNIFDAGIQFCSIISCLNNSVASCVKPIGRQTEPLVFDDKEFDKISLHSTIFHNVHIETQTLDYETFSFPSLLELSNDPESYGSLMNSSQFSFYSNGSYASLTLFSDNLITACIYGRLFSRDHKGSSSSILTPTLLVLICSILFLVKRKF